MSFGRRGGPPSAPPIPVPPLPPSAYGLVVPGAPLVPAQSVPPPSPPAQPAQPQDLHSYPPPPPSALPAATAAPAPAAAPSDLSGFFGGPVAPVAQFGGSPSQFGTPQSSQFGTPQPSQFGTPQPSQFGGPPSQFGGAPANPFGGAPANPFGAPTWQATPAGRGSRTWAKVLGGIFAVLIGGSILLHLYVSATAHHVGSLPMALQDATRDDSAQAQGLVAAAQTRASANHDTDGLTHQQVGIFRASGTVVVAEIADLPANSAVRRNQILNSSAGDASGASFSSVTPGRQGGSESCATTSTGATCAWVDDGTMGVVFVNSPDQAAAEAYLQTLRDATEH